LPGEIDLIEAFRNGDPDLRQIACFDTAFHHDMPRVAQIVPIARRFEAAGGSGATAFLVCRMRT
jgi:acetate kinase